MMTSDFACSLKDSRRLCLQTVGIYGARINDTSMAYVGFPDGLWCV